MEACCASFAEFGDHSSMRWRSAGNASDARRVPPCTWLMTHVKIHIVFYITNIQLHEHEIEGKWGELLYLPVRHIVVVDPQR